MCRGKSYAAVKRRTRRLGVSVKKTKRGRGANERPMVLNASARPLHHSDLLHFSPLCDNMIDNLTGRRGKALVFKSIGRVGLSPLCDI